MEGQHRMLTLLSANVRGLRSNLGTLTNMAIINKADIIICTETFLDETLPKNVCRISGYSPWERRDRKHGTKGGVAVCYKEEIHIQPLTPNIPDPFEIIFFKLFVDSNNSVLICALYRPQWQGRDPLEFLSDNLDNLMLQHNCTNVILLGDWNQHLVQDTFDEFLSVHSLHNHVDFPTHLSGSSLDPVISDIPDLLESCEPLSLVGTSDHHGILTRFRIAADKDNRKPRTLWLWEKGDWETVRQTLRSIKKETIFNGSPDNQAIHLTEILLDLQRKHVPQRQHIITSQDQPWFGYRCRLAADKKYLAWKRLKRRPTFFNSELHRQECARLNNTVKWAKSHWFEDVRKKLKQGKVGTKQWWSIVQNQQGLSKDDLIPPLINKEGNTATSSQNKADTLAQHFSGKITVKDPTRQAPVIIPRTNKILSKIDICESKIEKALANLDTSKAIGPDGVSPHTLRQCSKELAPFLAAIFKNCIKEEIWPKIWKSAKVIPAHKKNSKTLPKNYRPISLLPILSKVFEELIASSIKDHLLKNRLLSQHQFGFQKGKSASDLLLLLSSKWNKELDSSKETSVIALDIAGAFDTVWHEGLLSKIKSLGITGNLLSLLESYLKERSLVVAVDGADSESYAISAGVPQGSLLGPLLWNIFLDDLLQQIPEAVAYADDLTIHISYGKEEANNAAERLQNILNKVTKWGEKWQIQFAAEKSQSMVISRRKVPINRQDLHMGGQKLQETEKICILGVKFDSTLNFSSHINNIAKQASQKLAAMRRILHLLTTETATMLYKSQVRSAMEYACLTWSGSAQMHLKTLDKIQARALFLIAQISGDLQPIDSLQHRRDVAGLTVLYKAQELETPHLEPLKQPLHHGAYLTRANERCKLALEVPFAHTSQYQRSFVYHYVSLWNKVYSLSTAPYQVDVHRFKCFANRAIPVI